MTERRYTVRLEPAEEDGFVATCPVLPGVATEGDTLEEAREMVKDAIRRYLESLAKENLPAPPPCINFTEEGVSAFSRFP
jgi:predicted RNase H-like HicB family nuclease